MSESPTPDEGPVPDAASTPPGDDAPGAEEARCDVCGSTAVAWQRCKLVCLRCRTILMTCGDL